MSQLRNAAILCALVSGFLVATSPLGCSGGDSGTSEVPTDASVTEGSVDASDSGGGDSETGPCATGEPGCACLTGGTCTKGECIKDKCVDCARGAEACLCRLNGTCDTGLNCADGICAKCVEGTAGCPCAGGMTCNAGLKCSSGTCVMDSCSSGADGCGCRATEPRCDTGLYCNGGTTCAMCSSDVVGCPCSASGTCTSLVCDKGACRTAVTCADLVAKSLCVKNQVCTEGTKDTDAVCVPSKCIDNFRWDSASSSCVACTTPDYRWDNSTKSCVKCATSTCDAESCGADPKATTCAGLARGCKLDVDGKVLDCGGCLPGYDPPTSGLSTDACVPKAMCGTVVCGSAQYCDRSGAKPACVDRPCGVGEAKTKLGCASCGSLKCTGAGTTGSIWPFVTADDRCFCEPGDGYFVPSGSSLPIQCDADADGWVRNTAEQIRKDPALTSASRCDVHRVGTVHLIDEYGGEQIVDSCTSSGLVMRVAPATGCPSGDTISPITLIEDEKNDGPALRTDSLAPQYPVAGSTTTFATIPPAMLNGLTKFCRPNSDGDLAKGDDIAQAQDLKPGVDDPVSGKLARLNAFAYFAEIYTSKYVAPTGSATYGDLYIYEMSRCRDDFPFHYDVPVAPATTVADTWSPTNANVYWRNCQRNRDPSFKSSQPTAGINMDFSQWSCADGTDTCSTLPPPASKDYATPTDPSKVFLRNHGLCFLGGAAPVSKQFRGMNHHSQFKCVNVVSGLASNPYDVPVKSFDTDGTYRLNSCGVTLCAGSPCPVTSVGGTGASSSPKLSCTAKASAVGGGVGWALVNFLPYGAVGGPTDVYSAADTNSYRGGCINEDAHWQSYICPFMQFSASTGGSDASTRATYKSRALVSYGRYTCFGDLQNYLWAPDTLPSPVDISTIYWGEEPLGTNVNSSVLR